MRQPNRPRSGKRFLAWIPAVLTIGIGLTSALGIAVVPGATAASTTATVNVTATVNQEIFINNPCVGAGAVNFGSLTTGLDDTAAATTCLVQFGSNNVVNATLSISNTGSNPNAAPFFCARATPGDTESACLASQFTDSAVGAPNMAEGAMGVGWTANSDCTMPVPLNWDAGDKNPILTAGTTVCTETGMGLPRASFTFQFWADPAPAQTAATYEGMATVTATAT